MTTPPDRAGEFTVIALESVGSTNDEARSRAVDGAPDRTLIWSREQTLGRGRRDRDWSSPVGNLYTSLILRPGVDAARMPELSFVAALGLYDGLVAIHGGGDGIALKWPNDVLFNGRKTAGLLLETEGDGWVVLGMGLNVASFPDGTRYPATSLRHEGVSVSVEGALAAYIGGFGHWDERWRRDGFGPVREAWLARCKGLGEALEVRLGRETVSGVFRDLDGTGALVLDCNGAVRHITAGDVYFAHGQESLNDAAGH